MFRAASFRNNVVYAVQSAVDSALAAKADSSALSALEGVVGGKADASALSALEQTVAGKVDQSEVSAALALKADATALAAKADQSAVDAALAGKADATDLAAKADQSAVDAALAGKADATALAAKADQSAVDAALLLKADSAAVGEALSAKAEQVWVETALADKADKTAVDAALLLKADEAALQSLATDVAGKAAAADLAAKADQSAVDAALAGKADAGAFATAEAKVAALDEAMLIVVGPEGALSVETAPGSGVPFVYNGTLGGEPQIIQPAGTFVIGNLVPTGEPGNYTATFGWAFQNADGGVLTGMNGGSVILGPINIDAAGMANGSVEYPYTAGATYKIVAFNATGGSGIFNAIVA